MTTLDKLKNIKEAYRLLAETGLPLDDDSLITSLGELAYSFNEGQVLVSHGKEDWTVYIWYESEGQYKDCTFNSMQDAAAFIDKELAKEEN